MGNLDSASLASLVEALVTCSSLVATLIVLRTNRWLRVLLEREKVRNEQQITSMHAREMQRSNQTLRTLSSAYALEERTTLEGLLGNEQGDFTVASAEPFELKQKPPPLDLGPLPPTSRASGTRPTDWTGDDEDTTVLPETSSGWPRRGSE
jgi:ABC-type transporter Mla MlaB component